MLAYGCDTTPAPRLVNGAVAEIEIVSVRYR